jgi:hypothetical protein
MDLIDFGCSTVVSRKRMTSCVSGVWANAGELNLELEPGNLRRTEPACPAVTRH